MSRIRIEGLLAAFPKLVGSGKQHTYVETENVRYLYQPIEVGAASNVGAALSDGGFTTTPATQMEPAAGAAQMGAAQLRS